MPTRGQKPLHLIKNTLLCHVRFEGCHRASAGKKLPKRNIEDASSRKILTSQRLQGKQLYIRERTVMEGRGEEELMITLPCFFSGKRLLFHGSFWLLQAFFYAFLHIPSGLLLLFYKRQANQQD